MAVNAGLTVSARYFTSIPVVSKPNSSSLPHAAVHTGVCSRHLLWKPFAARPYTRRLTVMADSRGFRQRLGNWSDCCKARLVPVLIAGLLTISPGPAGASQLLQGPPRVVDGDTLEVAGEKVRLFGLDAPEKAQSCTDAKGSSYLCGQKSADALRAKIGTDAVACTIRTKDLYGRNVSSCSLPGTGDIGDWLVKNGYAVAYRQYSKDYVQDEEAARQAHRGIWEGQFQEPAEWRKENKGTGSKSSQPKPSPAGPSLALLPTPSGPGLAAPSSECQIKGNISSNGKIYHVPGGRYYEGVKIEAFKGERWFCSTQEAEAAGWRPSGT